MSNRLHRIYARTSQPKSPYSLWSQKRQERRLMRQATARIEDQRNAAVARAKVEAKIEALNLTGHKGEAKRLRRAVGY